MSIDILTDKIIKVYKAYLAKYLDLSYKEETEQDLKNSIKLVLIIFQQKEEMKVTYNSIWTIESTNCLL